jgi:hypothetical protein
MRYLVIAGPVVVATGIVVACSNDYVSTATPDAGVDAAPVPQLDSGKQPIVDAGVVDSGSTCSPGYAPSDAGCTFVNPFLDPSFQGTPPNAWTLASGATLLTSTPTASGTGVGRLCDANGTPAYRAGTIAQTITMPAQWDSLALEAVIETTAPGSGGYKGPLGVYANGRSLFDDDRQTSEHSGDQTITIHRCLGEHAFGGSVAFLFANDEPQLQKLDLDLISVVADQACPKPGVVANGDFESAGVWATQNGGSVIGGIGTNGSRALQLTQAGNDRYDQGTSSISIPETSMKHPALSVAGYGTGDFRVLLDGNTFARLTTTGKTSNTVCLPAFTQGLVFDLGFAHGGNLNGDFTGTATDPPIAIDDVKLVDEPSCTSGDNRDFEASGDPMPGWYTFADTNYAATLKTTAGGAHSGAGYFELEAQAASCSGSAGFSSTGAILQQTGVLPASSLALGGPAVTFWYVYTAGGQDAGTTAVNPGYLLSGLARTTAWTKAKVCLAPQAAGRRVPISFSLYAFSGFGTCNDTVVDIDDVVVTNDPSCPFE